MEGGEGGVEVNADGGPALCQEVWELVAEPVHLLHPTGQQLCVYAYVYVVKRNVCTLQHTTKHG